MQHKTPFRELYQWYYTTYSLYYTHQISMLSTFIAARASSQSSRLFHFSYP